MEKDKDLDHRIGHFTKRTALKSVFNLIHILISKTCNGLHCKMHNSVKFGLNLKDVGFPKLLQINGH